MQSDAAMTAEEEARLQEQQPPPRPVSILGDYVKRLFDAAKRHRDQTITAALLADQRQREGEYDPDKLAEIHERGGSDLYFNLTDTKCLAAESWIQDVLAPQDDKPFELKPTPVPDLRDDERQAVQNQVVTYFREVTQQTGVPPTAEEIIEYTDMVRDAVMKDTREKAQKRADRMTAKIVDQMAEGGFAEAFDDFIYNLCTYRAAFLKGPVLQKQKRTTWADGQIQVKDEIVQYWYAPDPFNIYPSPNARTIQDGYLCEVIPVQAADLYNMIGVEGYNEEAIRGLLQVAAAAPDGTGDITPPKELRIGQDEHLRMQSLAQTHEGYPDTPFEIVQFWGHVRGSMLEERGYPAPEGQWDPDRYYPVCVDCVGDVDIRAILNPDPRERRPYGCASWERRPQSIWGRSIPQKMRDCQTPVNAALRNTLNNMALASGPQVAADVAAVSPESKVSQIMPWMIWWYDSRETGGNDQPIRFFQPSDNSQALLHVSEYFESKADDRTMVPRYIHGNEDVRGAGETASGMSMLLNAAAKGIKKVILNIDRHVIRPTVEALYYHNMEYDEDDSIKGDCQVVARGALALLIREQTQLRRQEYLDRTNNEIDMRIIGIKGRYKLLKAIGDDLDIPDLLPDEQTFLEQEMERQAQEAAMAASAAAQTQEPVTGAA